jgi:cytochrome d ubiquinol oxidase subunit I
VHFISTIGVFLGSMFSAVWIVVANSWQQTPAGYHIVGEGFNARAEVTDFWAMVFNPSSVDRIIHVWQGAFLAGAFMVLSVHAYYIRKGKYLELSKRAFKIALVVATVVSFTQLISGHSSADGVAVNQPAKLAAMEGHYEKSAPADLYLLGWVDNKKQEVTGIGVPGGLSFLVHQDLNEPITGLNAFPKEDQPSQVNAVFQFYHIMISIGMFLIALSFYACFLWWKGKLFETKWILWIFSFAVLLPQIANQAGWFAAEMGRQPWIVYGHLRTSEGFSQEVSANQIVFSLVLFLVVYSLLFLLFLYSLNKKIKHGPYEDEAQNQLQTI